MVQTIGDMHILGEPPERLGEALRVIAERLHSEFDRCDYAAGKSKTACMIAAMAVRDILMNVGFDDCEARPVAALLVDLTTKYFGSFGLPNGEPAPNDHWSGHMVVVVPSAGYLIDATLYAPGATGWCGPRGMFAVPLCSSSATPLRGLHRLADVATEDGLYRLTWLDAPDNDGWRKFPDALKPRMRKMVVRSLTRSLTSPSTLTARTA